MGPRADRFAGIVYLGFQIAIAGRKLFGRVAADP